MLSFAEVRRIVSENPEKKYRLSDNLALKPMEGLKLSYPQNRIAQIVLRKTSYYSIVNLLDDETIHLPYWTHHLVEAAEYLPWPIKFVRDNTNKHWLINYPGKYLIPMRVGCTLNEHGRTDLGFLNREDANVLIQKIYLFVDNYVKELWAGHIDKPNGVKDCVECQKEPRGILSPSHLFQHLAKKDTPASLAQNAFIHSYSYATQAKAKVYRSSQSPLIKLWKENQSLRRKPQGNKALIRYVEESLKIENMYIIQAGKPYRSTIRKFLLMFLLRQLGLDVSITKV